jgi:hypothetical protein
MDIFRSAVLASDPTHLCSKVAILTQSQRKIPVPWFDLHFKFSVPPNLQRDTYLRYPPGHFDIDPVGSNQVYYRVTTAQVGIKATSSSQSWNMSSIRRFDPWPLAQIQDHSFIGV